MNKKEFMQTLQQALSLAMPPHEIERVLNYYDELIDDAIESGRHEEQVIETLPSPLQIAHNVKAEMNQPEVSPEDLSLTIQSQAKKDFVDFGTKVGKKSVETAQDIQKAFKEKNIGSALAKICGLFFFMCIIAPIIFSLIVSVYAVVLSLYGAAISVIISGFAVIITGVVCGFMTTMPVIVLAFVGIGLIIMAFGMIFFRALLWSSKGLARATASVIKGIGRLFRF